MPFLKNRQKHKKVGRYATMLGAAVCRCVVSTDDTQTLGDFDAGPTNTLMQLARWSRRAFAKIANKLKVGLEVTIGLFLQIGASFTVLNKTLVQDHGGIKSLNEKSVT